MNGTDVKEAVKQIHISEQMQEEMIVNIQKKMDSKMKTKRRLGKMAAAAAAVLAAGSIVAIPAKAVISNLVRERMESVPAEEVQDIENMIEKQDTEADSFSREYSAAEKARDKELWQAYKEGTFPEKEIVRVGSEDEVTEGALCYVDATGMFYLPEGEMTDEEILEIIDFQHKMSYAVSESTAAKEAKEEMQTEKQMLRDKIEAAGGISEAEAIEIAERQMKAELGEDAEGKEILRYEDGSAAVLLLDISEAEYEHTGDVAYYVIFCDDNSAYYCTVDSVDGSVLETD